MSTPNPEHIELAVRLLAEGKSLKHQRAYPTVCCQFCDLHWRDWYGGECSVLLRAAVDVLVAELAQVKSERDGVRKKLMPNIPTMDWGQVVANGGPPCFHDDGNGYYCGRAERWLGHNTVFLHNFVSLEQMMSATVAAARTHEREQCAEIAVNKFGGGDWFGVRKNPYVTGCEIATAIRAREGDQRWHQQHERFLSAY